MALIDVLSRVILDGQSIVVNGQVSNPSHPVVSAIANIYNGSPTAQGMLDLIVASGRNMYIDAGSENKSVIGGFIVEYNVASASSKYFINSQGEVVNYSFERVLTHELIHAIVGYADFPGNIPPVNLTSAGYDYVGDTVRAENLIYMELGSSDDRNSYHATISAAQLETLDVAPGGSLTGGDTIGLAIVDVAGYDEIDTTTRTDSVLLVGLHGADKIRAGGGDDYLYGGEGNDILSGGEGTDRLRGNAGSDILVGGSNAPTDPAILNLGQANVSWDDNARDYLSGGAGQDTYLIYSDRTHFGGPSSWAFIDKAFNEQIDFINGSDEDFDAYFQFKYDGQVMVAHVTGADIQGATPIPDTENTEFDIGVEVTFFTSSGSVTKAVSAQLIGTSLLLQVAFPGNEQFAILGGIYNFTPPGGGGPGDPTDPTDPVDPTDPGDTGWLGVDDIVTASVNNAVFIDPTANDAYPNGAQAETIVATSVTHGSLVSNGSFYTYNPKQGFSGVDTFRYHLSDDSGIRTSETALSVIVVGEDIELAVGTDSNETLAGSGSKDVVWGRLGDDTLLGGQGSDTYIYSKGDGDDFIDDEAGSTDDVDILRFTDISISDLTFTLDSVNSVVITVNSTSDVVTLDEQTYAANEGWGLERIEFANGISINLTHSREEAWTYNGTNGDDSITSAIWGQKDIFIGGSGDDYLNGEAGSDTYVYASGDGSDIIDDEVGFLNAGNVDVLEFTNINADDVTFSRSGVDLKIFVTATGDVITVDDQFYSSTDGWGLEQIKFADNSLLDRDDILAFV